MPALWDWGPRCCRVGSCPLCWIPHSWESKTFPSKTFHYAWQCACSRYWVLIAQIPLPLYLFNSGCHILRHLARLIFSITSFLCFTFSPVHTGQQKSKLKLERKGINVLFCFLSGWELADTQTCMNAEIHDLYPFILFCLYRNNLRCFKLVWKHRALLCTKNHQFKGESNSICWSKA